jgi:hypothetical protein
MHDTDDCQSFPSSRHFAWSILAACAGFADGDTSSPSCERGEQCCVGVKVAETRSTTMVLQFGFVYYCDATFVDSHLSRMKFKQQNKIMMENIHSETYSLLIDAYIKDQPSASISSTPSTQFLASRSWLSGGSPIKSQQSLSVWWHLRLPRASSSPAPSR